MHRHWVHSSMSIQTPHEQTALNTDIETKTPEGDDIGAALDAMLKETALAPTPSRKLPVHVPITRKEPLRLGQDSEGSWMDSIVFPEEDKSSSHLEALLISQHRRVLENCPRTLEAFRTVLLNIQQRTAPVNHAAAATGTPFSARDVSGRSAALEEKLPALVLARRLEFIYAHSASGLELFDHPVRPAPSRDNRVAAALFDASRAQAARFAAVAVLLRPVVESLSAFLVTDSPRELFEQISTLLSLGIETGRWSKLHPSLKDIADLLSTAANNVAPLVGTLENGRLLRLAAIQQAQVVLGLRN